MLKLTPGEQASLNEWRCTLEGDYPPSRLGYVGPRILPETECVEVGFLEREA